MGTSFTMQIRKAIGSRQSLSRIGGFKRLNQAWGKGDADRSKSYQVFCKVKSNRLWRPPLPSSLCHIPKYTLIDTTFNCPTLQGSFSNTNTPIKYLIVWVERQVGNIIMVLLLSGPRQTTYSLSLNYLFCPTVMTMLFVLQGFSEQ